MGSQRGFYSIGSLKQLRMQTSKLLMAGLITVAHQLLLTRVSPYGQQIGLLMFCKHGDSDFGDLEHGCSAAPHTELKMDASQDGIARPRPRQKHISH